MRPEILDGKTTKIIVGCGSLFLTLNFKDDGTPFELFLNGSKLGGCLANQGAIGRLVTICFQGGISIDTVIDQLELITCPACTRKKAKLTNQEEVRNFPTSCGDAVAKFLRKVKK